MVNCVLSVRGGCGRPKRELFYDGRTCVTGSSVAPIVAQVSQSTLPTVRRAHPGCGKDERRRSSPSEGIHELGWRVNGFRPISANGPKVYDHTRVIVLVMCTRWRRPGLAISSLVSRANPSQHKTPCMETNSQMDDQPGSRIWKPRQPRHIPGMKRPLGQKHRT